MSLSLEEMERDAYQRGDMERAELLRLACDGSEDVKEDLEQAQDDVAQANNLLADVQTIVFNEIGEIKAAIKEGDTAHALAVADRLYDKIERI